MFIENLGVVNLVLSLIFIVLCWFIFFLFWWEEFFWFLVLGGGFLVMDVGNMILKFFGIFCKFGFIKEICLVVVCVWLIE